MGNLNKDFVFIMIMKIVFVIIFEHVVMIMVGTLKVLISDLPDSVKLQIQREKLVARETAFEKEFKHSTSFSEERSDEDPNFDFNDRPRNILSVAASRQRSYLRTPPS